MLRLNPGMRIMMGEFVGAGEPARCIEWLLDKRIGDLTLIAVTPGIRGGFLVGRLFEQGQVSELVSTHVATSTEASDAYLSGKRKVTQFYPMGTWAQKVRAGAVGLGGILVPVGVGILDQPRNLSRSASAQARHRPWRPKLLCRRGLARRRLHHQGLAGPDPLGNVEFRLTGRRNQRGIAMAGDFTIAEVNEIVPVGTIDPEHVGCPGPFVNAVVQGYSLEAQHKLYRDLWIRLGRLAPLLEDAQ